MKKYTFKLKNGKYDKGMVTPDMWSSNFNNSTYSTKGGLRTGKLNVKVFKLS